ncbi:MAG: hypothetical protein AAF740_12595 [Bacteroidota bacterium]
MLLLFLLPILLLAFVIGSSVLLFRFIDRKGYRKGLGFLAFTPVWLLAYVVYAAVYPDEEFYREDFVEVTGVELPEEAKFQFKTASYPDHFGDYTSVSVIELEGEFYRELPKVLKEKGFVDDNDYEYTEDCRDALEDSEELKVKRTLSSEQGSTFYLVGFFSDEKTIIVKRISW